MIPGGQLRNGKVGPQIDEVDFMVLTVIFTVWTDPSGVTEEGENAHVAPAGRLVQLN